MKQLKISLITVFLFTIATFVIVSCKKEIKKSTEPIIEALTPVKIYNLTAELTNTFTSSEISCISDVQNSFPLHNEIMSSIINEEIHYSNEQDFTNQIIDKVATVTGVSVSPEVRNFMQESNEKYLSLINRTPLQNLNNMLTDNIVTTNEKNVMATIYNTVNNLPDYSSEILFKKLKELKLSLIDNNELLSSDEKCKLLKFIIGLQNSADLYQPYIDNSDVAGKKTRKVSCRKCISKHVFAIVFMDAGGIIVGVAGCFIFPPACPILLPAMFALGSGGAIAFSCPQCVGL